jgi:hypothetical protein
MLLILCFRNKEYYYYYSMTFLWAQVELDWTPLVFRYYNDLFWYEQIITFLGTAIVFLEWCHYFYLASIECIYTHIIATN